MPAMNRLCCSVTALSPAFPGRSAAAWHRTAAGARRHAGDPGSPLGGGCLYLFTDGLTEARCQDMMLGDQGVRRLLSEAAALPASARLTSIVERLAPPGHSPRDDLTLMVVEDRRAAPLLSIRFEASPACLCDLRRQSRWPCCPAAVRRRWRPTWSWPSTRPARNIIRHGYRGKGEVALEIRRNNFHRLEVQLIDFAAPADTAKIQPRCLDDLRPGGLGTHFMRSVMDEVCFLPPPAGAGNLLRMTKAIP